MKTIIVPTDLSACANNALKYAIQFAVQSGCRIKLVHVMPPHTAIKKNIETEHLKMVYLQIYTALGLPDNLVPVTFKIISGVSVPEAILAEARAVQASLIIMGSHGEGYMQQAFFGSNATNTLFKATLPVLLVPGKCRFQSVTKLVCATDMENVKTELQYVSKLARMLIAEMEVLYLGYGWDKKERAADFDRLVKTSYPYVGFRYKKMNAENPLVINLQQHMRHSRGELMVIFPNERRFLDKLLLNSTTEKLTCHQGKPVLAIRKYILKQLSPAKNDDACVSREELNSYLFNTSART